MNSNNQNEKHPKYDYYVKYNKYINDFYAQTRCPATCPIDQSQCTLTAGHWGKHKCPQGHEWL